MQYRGRYARGEVKSRETFNNGVGSLKAGEVDYELKVSRAKLFPEFFSLLINVLLMYDFGRPKNSIRKVNSLSILIQDKSIVSRSIRSQCKIFSHEMDEGSQVNGVDDFPHAVGIGPVV